jgi:phosphohistidine phosphatase
MLLYLLRHADAATQAESDDARRLSAKGIEQAKRVARFCEAHELQLSLVMTSPLKRARETAEFVAEQMRSELLITPWLASGMNPEQAIEELKGYRSHNSLMLVGHEPDFSQLIATLVGIPSNTQIRVRKASLTLLELDVIRAGAARLEFTLPCRLM